VLAHELIGTTGERSAGPATQCRDSDGSPRAEEGGEVLSDPPYHRAISMNRSSRLSASMRAPGAATTSGHSAPRARAITSVREPSRWLRLETSPGIRPAAKAPDSGG